MAYRAVDMNDRFALTNVDNAVRVTDEHVFTVEERRQHAELLQRYDIYQGLYGDIHPVPGITTSDPRNPNMVCDLKMVPTIDYTYSEMIAQVINRIASCGGTIFLVALSEITSTH